MKTSRILKPVMIILLAFSFVQTFAAQLYINDPRGWNWSSCNISEATLSIKPKGIYMEYGLYLTFKPTQSFTVNDTFEIVMNFDLPKGAFIHDSWLWVDNQIVQAELLERWTAFNIYEGIVNRRKDPSVLYKNSDTNYEIRIFPMAGNSSRKIKITYLVPTDFSTQSVSAALPQNIFNMSAIMPNLEVLAYSDATWKDPQLLGADNSLFTFDSQANNYRATLSATQLNNNSISISYKSPLRNGFYVEQYATAADEGYYQFVTIPNEILPNTENKKVAFVLDHRSTNFSANTNSLINDLKKSIYNYFSEGDSFNIILARPNTLRISNVWLHADSANIENAFAQITQSTASLSTNTSSLLINAIDFISDNNYEGSIVLLTNDDEISQATQANNLVTDLKLLMYPNNIRIDVLCYQNTNFNYYPSYINNDYYYGNSYFNQKLARETGGNYFQLYETNSNNYYYYYNPQIIYTLYNRLGEMLSMISGKIADFDLYNSVDNGFCYGRFDVTDNYTAYLKKPVVQVGKYLGNGNFETTISGRYNGNIFSQTFQVNNIYQTTDTLVKKMWANAHINQLEKNALTNQAVQEVIDSSINNRVLSRYTAFLALEPNDTISVCETCPDETNNGPITVSVKNIEETFATINASPNPFSDNVTITITLTKNIAEDKFTIEIYDMVGKLVYTIIAEKDKATNSLKTKWNGIDNNNTEAASGIYMAVVKTSNGTLTQKIIKQ
jgi:hypothetical protein